MADAKVTQAVTPTSIQQNVWILQLAKKNKKWTPTGNTIASTDRGKTGSPLTTWTRCTAPIWSLIKVTRTVLTKRNQHTFLISSRVYISGDSPPWTQRNCLFMRAASGRASNDLMHASYTASEYLILPEDVTNKTNTPLIQANVNNRLTLSEFYKVNYALQAHLCLTN